MFLIVNYVLRLCFFLQIFVCKKHLVIVHASSIDVCLLLCFVRASCAGA